MKKFKNQGLILAVLIFAIHFLYSCGRFEQEIGRHVNDFNENWKFLLDSGDYSGVTADDASWRNITLPHDWSIEGSFSKDNPATVGGGALPGGIGWYRKYFTLPEIDSGKNIFIQFDGIYMNSEVYLNGVLLGKRPNGYISFYYELNPHLYFGEKENVLSVKVDNSNQPNSRWYSGSGIYRNVKLIKTDPAYIPFMKTYITTPKVDKDLSTVIVKSSLKNSSKRKGEYEINLRIIDANQDVVSEYSVDKFLDANAVAGISRKFDITSPDLWSLKSPVLYKLVISVFQNGMLIDQETTRFGIRSFHFDPEKGFFLNNEPLKILGVCNHHDLGCLGTAVNKRALERQLELLKGMGCNAIRTSHNPPAPQLLDLCDQMGFLVMDEAFDMWKKRKTKYDYSNYWDEWHVRDLEDQIRRDRNHACVFLWSIGNEVLEQWDPSGTEIAKELIDIVRNIDNTREIVSANNSPIPENYLLKAGEMDVIGYNYKHNDFVSFPTDFPGKCFLATETTSGLMTRGCYDMPSDSIRRWPDRWDLPFKNGNPDNTVSAYDNVSTPWGSTHEETWSIIKKHDFLSGMFIWTGFDYLGEPTPYGWPSRSSYFGIIDLAGFPKDVYYMYKSEWTNEPVLHLFPHWNWKTGDKVDVLAYTNCKSVELFLNGESMGLRQNSDSIFHLRWNLNFVPGELKAKGILPSGDTITTIVKTAGKPARIELIADRSSLKADGKDLSFITANVLDENGTIVPYADNLITCDINGMATLAGTDNGDPVSHESFKVNYRKAFNGKCLFVIQAGKKPGAVTITAKSENLKEASIVLDIN